MASLSACTYRANGEVVCGDGPAPTLFDTPTARIPRDQPYVASTPYSFVDDADTQQMRFNASVLAYETDPKATVTSWTTPT
jgi:hypothetical protein